MAAPVSIAVIGAGAIGRRHAAHIRAEPAARLHAVVDPAEAGRAFADEIGAAWFASFQAMLAAGRPDAVIVATPNRLHVEHGLAAIAAGLPTLVEKPIADDLAGAARLVAAADAAGVALLVGHHRRHNPLVERARATIESGRLGAIVAVQAFVWLMKPDDYFDVAWRREPGAGPVLLNLIHDVDLLRHLCGDIVEVMAFASNAARGHAVEDTAVAILRFSSGALGAVNVSDAVVAPWNWEQTAAENPAYPASGEICCLIAGAKGSLSIPRLDLWSNEGTRGWFEPLRVERIVAAAEDPLARQIRHFCAVARGEAAPLVSGREGMKTLAVIEAIRGAAASGRSVKVAT
ncbi:MAG: Gfo/Idh/MocA family oxidoreductase [Methylobacteriaceae bacterium]|nr:Gfo/Idh/MocA family oxidoreductase [Methylobacteriaceae bacterium]